MRPAPTRQRRPRSFWRGISHVHLFLVGWIYYLFVPVAAGWGGLFETSESFLLMGRFASVDDHWWPALASYVFCIPVAFLLGSALAKQLPRVHGHKFHVGRSTRLLVPIYAVMLVAAAWVARDNLFQGYGEDLDVTAAGPIATLQMAALLQYLAAKAAGLPSMRWAGVLLAAASILGLSMGGRLYVLSALVAVYFYWWRYSAADDRARRRSLLAVLLVPMVFGVVGMVRLGFVDLSNLGFYVFAEPLFTSISALTAAQHPWSMFEVPHDFLSAFLNIVPSALWPDKASAVISLSVNSPIPFEAPFGAISIVTSSVGNFGVVGGLAFIGLVGFIMERSRQRSNASPMGRALYCYLCCLLPFMFFRDPFQVQVKLVITGFLLAWLNGLLSMRITPGLQKPAPRAL